MSARKVWVAVKTPLTMLLLLAFVVFAAMWGWKAANTPTPPRPPEPCVVQSIGPRFKPDHAVLRVYNSTQQNGLAKRVATILRADGFRVIRIANTQPVTQGVQIVGVAANSPEVVLVRSYFPGAKFTADPNKADHTVDITVGNGFKSVAPDPLTSVPVKGGKACIPRIQAGQEAEA
ncbi:LytR C-terminal domain-containing protein [Nigerium massiliense]|uniref:LytR C-terminal domain-containing protein n=1 Tax=Nigerium massiliense TaxID=1522317 RepID=UPI000693F145|nr:LytR C-terminal domain-containing protein [Nigerium massiliense]